MTEDTPMSLRADLDLAAMTRDDEGRWRAAAGMTTADTERPDAPDDIRFARGVVIGLMCSAVLWVAIVGWVVWRVS